MKSNSDNLLITETKDENAETPSTEELSSNLAECSTVVTTEEASVDESIHAAIDVEAEVDVAPTDTITEAATTLSDVEAASVIPNETHETVFDQLPVVRYRTIIFSFMT